MQLSVYSRLHVNEPADALVMLYANSDAPLADGAYRLSPRGATDRGMAADLSGLTKISSAASVQLTYFASGYYTLTVSDKRLSDNGGKVTLASATAGNEQMWALTGDSPYYLQNRATGRYLALADNSVSTVKDTAGATKLPVTADGSVWGSEGLFYPGSEGKETQLLANQILLPRPRRHHQQPAHHQRHREGGVLQAAAPALPPPAASRAPSTPTTCGSWTAPAPSAASASASTP